MKIYNVMTGKKQEFVPIEEGKAKVYACGITVNGEAHLGHARQAITFNMMTEYLRLIGFEVTYVRNYTDIDDKILVEAKVKGVDPLKLADDRINRTEKLISKLVTRDADFKPRVSLYISEIIEFVASLIEKGFAYESVGDVYFAVEKFSEYGKLSHRSTKDMLNNVRIEDNLSKNSPLDFALWKSATDDEFGFDSPWGKGRPGWHIECSTMIKSILGDTIDIHGGGKDLIFPHHENEIAQSQCHTGKPLANFWVHNGLITVGGQKMSKSLNNFVTVEQLLGEYDPEVIRFLMLQNHYSSTLEINDDLLTTAEKHMYSFYSAIDEMKKLAEDESSIADGEILVAFHQAMQNDFNISLFIAQLFGIFAQFSTLKGEQKVKKATEIVNVLKYIEPCTGLFNNKQGEFVEKLKAKYLKKLNLTEGDILAQIQQRAAAKREKNFPLADQIRANLLSQGIELMDTPNGTNWAVKL